MKKKIIIIAATTILSVSVLLTSTGFCKEKAPEPEVIGDVLFEQCEPYTFEEFKQCLKEDVSKDQIAKVKALFDKAMALEEKQDYEGASKIWDEIDSMDIYSSDCNDLEYTFEEFKKELKHDVTTKDLSKAKELFDKAIALDKEGKLDEAETVWDELYSMDIFVYETADMSDAECTFDDFKQGFNKDVSQKDVSKAKELYDKAIAFEKEDKYDEADKVWEQLFEMDIYDFECIECGEYTFEMLKEELKKDVSKEDEAKTKSLFDKALDLDKTGKYDEAVKVWDELYNMDIFQDVWVVNSK